MSLSIDIKYGWNQKQFRYRHIRYNNKRLLHFKTLKYIMRCGEGPLRSPSKTPPVILNTQFFNFFHKIDTINIIIIIIKDYSDYETSAETTYNIIYKLGHRQAYSI